MIMPAQGVNELWNRPKKVHFALFPYVVEIPARSDIECEIYNDSGENHYQEVSIYDKEIQDGNFCTYVLLLLFFFDFF